jgi:putative inorganic carbon (HCO3(-)) transporter
LTQPAAKRRANKPAKLERDWLALVAQGVLFVKIVLVLFVIDPQAADAFTLAKSAMSHVTAVVLVSAVAAILVRDGRHAIVWSPIHIPVVGLLIAFAFASIFALDPYVALYGAWRRYLGLTQLLDFVALYAATVTLIRTPADRRRLFTVCAAAAAIVVGYGLLQRAGIDVLSFREVTTVTPISTLGQPDVLGGFVGVVLAAVLAVMLLRWNGVRLTGRAGLVLLGAAAGALMLSSSVRNAVLALGAGWLMAIAIIYLGPARSRLVRYVPIVAAAVVAAGIAFSPLGARFQFGSFASDAAAQSRLEMWETSLRLIGDRPLLGVGPDNFAAGYPIARAERSELIAPGELQTSTHNWFLYYATGAGLAGALAILALLALAARAGVRLIRSGHPAAIALVPLAAYLGQGLVDVNDVGIDWIFWVALGIIATASGRTISAGRPQRRNWSAAAAIATALLIAALVVANAEQDRIRASEAQAISDALVTVNRGLDAVGYSGRATLFDPRRAEYWSGLGTALGTAGNRSAAETAYLDAARIEPWQPIYWRNAGLQRLAAGDEKAAFGSFEHATQLDPYDAQSRNLLARLAINRGDLARAVDEGERAARLAPSDPNVYEAPVQAHIQLGQWAEAERLLGTALSRAETAHLHVLLARVYVATARTPLALEQLTAALALEPANPEATLLQSQLKQ